MILPSRLRFICFQNPLTNPMNPLDSVMPSTPVRPGLAVSKFELKFSFLELRMYLAM